MSTERFERTTVKIPSATPGWDLEAWKYIPTGKGSSPHPVIILAHGFASNKRLGLDEYAEIYAAEGYACVVFDYRRWGGSAGSPRHVLKVSEQLEDYRTVINWARRVPEFDVKRIIAWGSSFSGGHIIQLASEDPDLAAALGQCPFAGPDPPSAKGVTVPTTFGLLKILVVAFIDVLKQSLGLAPYYIPTASEPGDGGALNAPGSLKGYLSIGRDTSYFPNQVNAACAFQVSSYNPTLAVSSIKIPLLLIVPEADNLCSVAGALEVGKQAKTCEIVRVGGGHFDLYPRHSEFDKALQAQLTFLRKHVPV